MNANRLVTALIVLGTALATACFADRVVAPDKPLPAVLAVSRDTVHLFRYAMGEVAEDTVVVITNNGGGNLGRVERVGGVEYLSKRRTEWLSTELDQDRPATVELPGNTDPAQAWYLKLSPTYGDTAVFTEKPGEVAVDTAMVFLKAEGSPDLKQVVVFVRTLPGASFHFETDPITFSGLSGDSVYSRWITVSNSGNGNLAIGKPDVAYDEPGSEWLSVPESIQTDNVSRFRLEVDPGTLTPGVYSARLDFKTSADQVTQAQPASLTVDLNVLEPQLSVSTSSLTFTAVQGTGDPPPQTIDLWNGGDGGIEGLGTLEISEVSYEVEGEWVSNGDDWLEVTPLFSDDLRIDSVRVRALTANAPIQENPSQAMFWIGSERVDPIQINVSFAVGQPVLTLSSTNVGFSGVEGVAGAASPASVTVRISNTGDGDFSSLGTISVTDPGSLPAWLTANLGPGDSTVVLAATLNGSETPGDLTATVTVTSSALATSKTIAVTLTVAPEGTEPLLSLSAESADFIAVVGGGDPAVQEVVISNAGGGGFGALTGLTVGPVPGSATGWLAATRTDNIITLTATTGSLAAGTYQASVPVTITSGNGDTAIDVTFIVGEPVLTLSSDSVRFSGTAGQSASLQSDVFLSNTGAGDFSSLGLHESLVTVYGSWVQRDPSSQRTYCGTPEDGDIKERWLESVLNPDSKTIEVTTFPDSILSADTVVACVTVSSDRGGSASFGVSLSVREEDRSFERPVIEFVDLATGSAINSIQIDHPTDSVNVESVGVKKEFATLLPLSGLRVEVVSDPSQMITGAYLDRTRATFEEPAVLYIVVEPGTLAAGEHEAELKVWSETLGEENTAKTFKVVLDLT